MLGNFGLLPHKHAADLQFQIWSTNSGSAAPAWIQGKKKKKTLNRFWILKARSNENRTKAAASGIESVIQMRGLLWGVRMKTGLDSTGLVPTDCLKWGTDLKQVLCVDRFGDIPPPLFLFFPSMSYTFNQTHVKTCLHVMKGSGTCSNRVSHWWRNLDDLSVWVSLTFPLRSQLKQTPAWSLLVRVWAWAVDLAGLPCSRSHSLGCCASIFPLKSNTGHMLKRFLTCQQVLEIKLFHV